MKLPEVKCQLEIASEMIRKERAKLPITFGEIIRSKNQSLTVSRSKLVLTFTQPV
jgi:hypothetical protein